MFTEAYLDQELYLRETEMLVDLLEREALDLGDAQPDVAEAGRND